MCPRPTPCSVEQSQGQEEKVAEAITPEVQNSNNFGYFVSEFNLPNILEGLIVQIGDGIH